jgi:photosystem II stability/assembly factor-like uncharacterized protein
MKNFSFIYLLVFVFSFAFIAQQEKPSLLVLSESGKASFRGMSVPADSVVWVSGSLGTVGKSTDAGVTWQWMTVPGFEKTDFRDIHAFDSNTAIIMAVGNPGYILKTNDGGKNWRKVFEKSMKDMFLDAMDFKNEKEGICIGDPIYKSEMGRKFFYILKTEDGGDSWTEAPVPQLPPVQEPGEAIFAASGTNISYLNHPDYEYAFVTGGIVSNIYFMGKDGKKNKVVNIPINQGVESAGTFSFATDRVKKYYCIGGDYKEPDNQFDNFYFSPDEGKRWGAPSVAPPFGYRSCIQLIDDKNMVACGTAGIDFCKDGGKEWINISTEGFNVCMVSPKSKYIYLAGDKGRVSRLVY